MRVRGFSLLQLGDTEAAREALENALAAARERGSEYEAALCLTGLLRVQDEATAGELARGRDAILERLGVVAVLAVPGEHVPTSDAAPA